MLAEAIIAAARACLGTPFAHQGRVPGRGLDCAGLAAQAAAGCGLAVDDLLGYPDRPRNGLLEAALDRQPCLCRVTVDDLQPGDLLLMRFRTEPQHLAILAGPTIIHAYAAAGVVCEHDFTPAWRARVVRCYRFRVAP